MNPNSWPNSHWLGPLYLPAHARQQTPAWPTQGRGPAGQWPATGEDPRATANTRKRP